MVKLARTFGNIGRRKILVIGDFMLDTYTVGKAKRISPEAPVAVIQVESEDHRPGGAGNVVLNLLSMGANVVPVGRIGNDRPGKLFKKALEAEKISTAGLIVQEDYDTPVKNRVIADNQQIVRVDHEKITSLPELVEERVVSMLSTLLEGVDLVAISDYGKGFLTPTLLAALIDLAKSKNIPVITDPKGVDFTQYRGTTIIKPNLGETYAAANLPPDASLDLAAERVLEMSQAETLMVTRSEKGISLFHRDGSREDFPVRVREVLDVTGAGDTVLAMLACALANGLKIGEAVELSNYAAGVAIEHLGCARVTLAEVARSLLTSDTFNKVFDEHHLFALSEALRDREFAVLEISASEGITTPIFQKIHQLSRRKGWDLVVYLKDSSEEFAELLASISDVDFILTEQDTLDLLVKMNPPDEYHCLEENSFLGLHVK